MNQQVPIKRLIKIALFTSTAIGLITAGPVYVLTLTLANIKLTNTILLKLIGFSIVGISLFVMAFWLLNIALLNYSIRKSYLFAKDRKRYIVSYLMCFSPFFVIWVIAAPILNNPIRMEQIINWKTKQLGLDPATISFLPFNNWIFQLLIMVFAVFSINSIVLIIQELVLLNDRKVRIENENMALRMKNIEATNQKLKQQLHPHFLFNSLNVLKTLIKKQPDNAEVYLKRLSDFLRASVVYDNDNTVGIEEELKLSVDYIEMQKIRFGDALQVEMELERGNLVGLLPPFSVQMLLENAIKHNAFTKESPLRIHLREEDGWITVSNRIQKKATGEIPSGMGLLNLSERYKLISGDEIRISSDETTFSVSIKILTNEDCNH